MPVNSKIVSPDVDDLVALDRADHMRIEGKVKKRSNLELKSVQARYRNLVTPPPWTNGTINDPKHRRFTIDLPRKLGNSIIDIKVDYFGSSDSLDVSFNQIPNRVRFDLTNAVTSPATGANRCEHCDAGGRLYEMKLLPALTTNTQLNWVDFFHGSIMCGALAAFFTYDTTNSVTPTSTFAVKGLVSGAATDWVTYTASGIWTFDAPLALTRATMLGKCDFPAGPINLIPF